MLERTTRREALPAVGATTIRRVLGDAGRSYQRTRTWCPTGTAKRLTPAEVGSWLEKAGAGWNAAPTPGVWHGRRWQHRLRARHRRLGGSGAGLADQQPTAA